jgi:hypothetical protein
MNLHLFFRSLVIIALLASSSACVGGDASTLNAGSGGYDKYPEFSWDHIPRYMHVWKRAAFTEEELDYLAQFPLITFEKATGVQVGSVQQGTLKAARGVKRRNPDAKILYYKNIVIDWGGSAASKELKTIKGAYLQSKDGSDATFNPHSSTRFFDIGLPDVRAWWMKDARRMLDDPSIDGIFIDANIKVLVDGFFRGQKKVEPATCERLKDGYGQLLTQIDAEFRSDSIVLGNIIRARLEHGGLDYLRYFDGSYLEAFEHTVGGVSRPDYIAKGIETVQAAARQGKIVAFTLGVKEALNQGNGGDFDSNESLHARVNYAAALFLIVAEKYSYFFPVDGMGVVTKGGKMGNRLWMQTLPIFKKRLGAPKGPATKNGYIYTREFEDCSVWLDVENEVGKLTWR